MKLIGLLIAVIGLWLFLGGPLFGVGAGVIGLIVGLAGGVVGLVVGLLAGLFGIVVGIGGGLLGAAVGLAVAFSVLLLPLLIVAGLVVGLIKVISLA